MRSDLAAMSVLIEKQDYSSGKMPISHAIFTARYLALQTDFKLINSPRLAPSISQCQTDLDALQYFWQRYETNPDCVLTNASDLKWLQALNLIDDTNVWMAFDFEADKRWFEADQAATAAKQVAILRSAGLPPIQLAELETRQRMDTLKKESDYLGRRLDEMDSILQAAAATRSHIYPTYILGKLLKRVEDDCNSLLNVTKSNLM